MARNKLQDVRDHLFAALEGLADKDEPLEVSRAKAIASVAQVIINTAKLELDFKRATGNESKESDFWVQKQLT